MLKLQEKSYKALTQLCLMGLRHLHQGIILLVEQNLDPLNISIHPCKVHHHRKGYSKALGNMYHPQFSYKGNQAACIRYKTKSSTTFVLHYQSGTKD